MGNFVDKNALSITVPTPSLPNKIEENGSWEPTGFDANPDSPYALIEARFNKTASEAEKWATELLTYLQDLDDVITAIPIDAINYTPVVIGTDIAVAVPDAPELGTEIDTNFPDFSPTPYSLDTIPTIDTSKLIPNELPTDITVAISWLESVYDDTLFQILYAQLLSDLSSGAGGLGGTVEQEIYDRAVARQDVDNDAKYQEIEEYAASRGFELPTGAMMGRLQEQANSIATQNAEINGKILIEQAELAQKNQQFVISSMSTLENVLREFHDKTNNRALDYEKAVATIAIQRYAEQMRGYIAAAEANKIYVEIQVSVLNATIASNKGLIEQFIAEANAFEAEIGAIGKKNEAITDVYKAEVMGYASETKAVSENQKSIIASYELKIKNADADLRAQITEAELTVQGYGSEYSLREKVAEAQANIAMQAMSSAYGAVNASAGMSYSGNESQSESWSHGETRSDSYSHTEAISNTASIGQTIGNNLSETHKYDET